MRFRSGGTLAVPSKSPHVPSQYYGYSLQCTHCVYLLLDAPPGSEVSVEVLEDVARQDDSGEIDAVQVKSAARTNPIANRSMDFWKTFRNWIHSIEAGELKAEKTTFHLRLGARRIGRICESFANASTPQSAALAADNAKTEFFTIKGGKFKNGISQELRAILEVVFAATNRASLLDIIVRFELSFGTGYAYEELLTRFKTKLIDEDIAEDVLLHALGWVKKEIDNSVERCKPPVIGVTEFRTEINAFRNRLKTREYLPSFAGIPSAEDIQLQKLRLFVRQLEWIKFPNERILGGITDFLTARTNRVQWAQRGYVHSESFLEFEKALKSLWQNHRDEIELNQGEDEVTRGRRLAYQCFRASLNLQGIQVTPDFVCGCFHTLADQPIIGWHPHYEQLLKTGELNDVQP